MQKKNPLANSLAIRVLTATIICVALPLSIFISYLFFWGYNSRVRDTYQILKSVESEQVIYLKQLIEEREEWLGFFVQLYHLYLSKIDLSEENVENFFADLSKQEFLSYISVIELVENGVFCRYSTNPNYAGVLIEDYQEVWHEMQRLGSFIAMDIANEATIFIAESLSNTTMILISIPLEFIVEKLSTLFQKLPTILSFGLDDMIIASSDPSWTDRRVTLSEKIHPEGDLVVIDGLEYFVVVGDFFLSSFIMLATPSINTFASVYESLSDRIYLFLLLMALGLLASLLFSIWLYRPMVALKGAMDRVGRGDLRGGFKPYRGGFEVNVLGNAFNKMADSLSRHLEEERRERLAKEAYAKEMAIGKSIQVSLLPEEFIAVDRIDTRAFFATAKDMGGDYYDWIWRSNKVFYVIADAVGKGISASLYALTLRSYIRSFVMSCDSLEELAEMANELFCQDTREEGSFVTAALLYVDLEDLSAHYLNCGHHHPILKRGNHVVELTSVGSAFGVDRAKSFKEDHFSLQEGDFIILFTDGLTESTNAQGELFSLAKLKETLTKSTVTKAQDLLDEIVFSVDNFRDGYPRSDDITIVVVRILEQL